MSFLMGLLSGASKQYVENVEAEREQEMEMAQLRATKQAAADKRAVDLMSKSSFYLTPGQAVGLGIADRNMAALVSNQDVPFFSYVRDYGKDGYENEFNQLINLKGVGDSLMGVTLENAARVNPTAYGEKYNQLRGAQVQAARRIYDQEAARLGVEAKTLRRQTIINRIPAYEGMSDANKMYIDGILAEASNNSVETAQQEGLIPFGSYGAVQPNGDIVIESDIQTIDNEKISVGGVPEEQVAQINSIVMSGANTYADTPSDVKTGTMRVAKKVQAVEKMYKVPMQQSINAITTVSGAITEGFVEKSASGTLYVSPSVQTKMKESLDPVFMNAGFGETTQIVQAALPNSFVPRATGSLVGASPAEKDIDQELSYYKRLGREKGDYELKYNQLKQLYSTADTLATLIADGTKVGLAGRLERLQSGVLSQAQQLFAGSPEAKEKFDQMYTSFTGAAPEDRGSKAEAVVNFLTNELAYNVARSLESATGNARLSQTDVERAAKSLALEGLFVSNENASAVLAVILKRTEYEMELADIMSSGNIPKMQAAQLVQSVYGTQNMLRTDELRGNSPSDIRNAFNAFMSDVRREAGIDVSQSTPNAQPKTGFSESR